VADKNRHHMGKPHLTSRVRQLRQRRLTHPQELINLQLKVHTSLIHPQGLINRQLPSHTKLTHPQDLINRQLPSHTSLIHPQGLINRQLTVHKRLIQKYVHIANDLLETIRTSVRTAQKE